MKLALNLDKQKIPNITKINRIPGFEEVLLPDGTELIGIKYFLFTPKHNKIPIIIRFTSINKSFSTLYGMDIYDKKGNPAAGLHFKNTLPEKELLKFISDLPNSLKYKNVNENYVLDSYLSIIQEGGFKNFRQILNDNPVIKAQLLMTFAPLAFAIALGFKWYITKYTKWREERRVEGPVEKKMNNDLFIGQKYNDPAFKMYLDLQNFIKFVALGKAPAIILCGPPGMSKTYIVRRTFHFENLVPGKDFNIEKGSSLSTISTYDLLFKNRDKILVLDDFDTPLRNVDTVNMLKAITDSYSKRILSFPTERTMSRSDGGEESTSPRKFEYRGKLIIITNLKKSEIDRALLSRAPAFEVNFSPKIVLASIDKMMQFMNPAVSMEVKREVLNYIIKLYKKQPSISIDFRSFKNSVDARVGNPLYWEDMVRTIVGYED